VHFRYDAAMAVHDFTSQRLFVEQPLAAGARLATTSEQANYLLNVLRLGAGDAILVFNGRDGEWRAEVARDGKRCAALVVTEQTRSQSDGPDLHYLFAPLKRARLDYMVQKATEMGASRLVPVLTRHTIAERVNLERLRANAIEAAEQCGILSVPEISEPVKLEKVFAAWDASRLLIFCDESAEQRSPIEALRGRVVSDPPGPAPRLAVLIGPEGGFAPEERAVLLAKPFVVPVSLGPRIMRADTAAVAALALVNAVLGDWRGP
jgi:16S rRNA (uracil1498-N3)-methyltransferase